MKKLAPLLRLYILINLGLLSLNYLSMGEVTIPDIGESAVYSAFLLPVLLVPFFFLRLILRPRQRSHQTGLNFPLYRWPTGDDFTLAHLLQSVAIFGQIGSGKTSSSGFQLALAYLS